MEPRSRRLAERSGAAVDLTACGRVLLHVGPLALKLEPAALVAIHGLIGDAIEGLAADVDGAGESGDEGPDPDWLRRIVERGRS